MATVKPNKLVLTYFPVPGRAGATRQALRYGKIEFEDRHVSGPDFAALKPTLPFGQVPVLDVDGVVLTQSNAQLVYAGRLAGLVPSDYLLEAQVHEVLNFTEDGISLVVPSIKETDEAKRLEMRKALSEPDSPLHKFLANVDRYLARNGKGTGWFVGDSLTVADLKADGVFKMLTSGALDGFPTTILDGYAAIQRNIAQTAAALKQ
mmetsp:Transcript_53499/g.134406  ORF Transcript_53499/g.134406 Transcript_53499/m.134406 type:complete len:206 (+) Transcript_53499:81-698(+)